MNNAILIGMAVVMILFVWSWIMVTILHRMSLEKKIEKLNNITNPLPEEEKTLNHYKELRAIEQSKVTSAKWVIVLFMLTIIGCAAATVMYEPLQEFFGYPPLAGFLGVCVVMLAFFCLPIFMGLTLAGGTTKDPESPEEVAETVEAAPEPYVAPPTDEAEEESEEERMQGGPMTTHARRGGPHPIA